MLNDHIGEENTLIGTALLSESALDDAAAVVKPDQILSHSGRVVFEAMLQVRARGEPPVLARVWPIVESSGIKEEDILALQQAAENPRHTEWRARRVLSHWKRREAEVLTAKLSEQLHRPDADVDSELNRHVSAVTAVCDDTASTECDGHVGKLLQEEEPLSQSQRITTGFSDLNATTDGGFLPGQLVCVGARPSVGKTALCSGVAMNCAQLNHPALFLSFEMSKREMADRFRRQSNGNTTRLESAPLFLREAAGWTIDRIESEARRYIRRHAIEALIVDYISLIRPRDSRLARYEQIGDISRSLKTLALRTGLVVVAAQQLSRSIESRENKLPRMSDFRESGSIEQDSDILIGLHRPVRFDDGDRTKATLHVLKNRNGECLDISLRYEPERCLFTDGF